MLARQKRWAAAFSLPFRKTGVGQRLERRERFAGRRGLRSRANDGRRVLLGFLCSRERAPFGLIDGLIWPKTRYASID